MVLNISEFNPAIVSKMVGEATAMAVSAGAVANSIGTSASGAMHSTTATSPAEITRLDSEYKTAYQAAQTNMTTAPINLSRAEKNYYVYNEGKSGGNQVYDALIIDRFAKTAQEFRTNSIEMQQQYMADLSQALRQYQAQSTFLAQSQKLLKTREEEHKIFKKNINYYQKIVETSERKVVYENKNMDSLYTYRRLMIFVYYAALIGFIIFGNFIPDKLYSKYTIWLILIIVAIIPIILNIVIKWLFIFYELLSYWFGELPHRDVYVNLGNPSDEKPPPPPLNQLTSLAMTNPAAMTASMSTLLAGT
jgi:hypothetical protein